MTKMILASLLIALAASACTSAAQVATADSLVSQSTAAAPFADLHAARARVIETRRQWDLAVAGDHPVAAGRWAMLHHEAVQAMWVAGIHGTAGEQVSLAPANR